MHSLYTAKLLSSGSKIVLLSSEAGSIALRHESEGGGNYGHHASKTALNMVGKLLAMDLQKHGITVGLVHPGFMKTEMTKGVGFDQFYEELGAIEPDEAARGLAEWTEKLTIEKTGEFWAPRGPNGIPIAEKALGKNLPTPLNVPW